jgi:hypothetical protein
MHLTLEFLQQQLAEAEQRHAQTVADLNGIIGEMRMLKALIAEAAKQPENPDLI